MVMYHQPTALPGLGGAYLYQWNDDRCNMKHNFICKYEPGRWNRLLVYTCFPPGPQLVPPRELDLPVCLPGGQSAEEHGDTPGGQSQGQLLLQ